MAVGDTQGGVDVLWQQCARGCEHVLLMAIFGHMTERIWQMCDCPSRCSWMWWESDQMICRLYFVLRENKY